MALFIGIDSGTQSVKAVVLDLEARTIIAEARAPHHLIEGLPVGHMEQNPTDWTTALDHVLREVAGKIPGGAVAAIGVSGQQHGFVPLDEDGEVIRPAKLWCDTSTEAECALLTKKLGGPRGAIRETGNLILPGFTAPKILWLKRNEPENFRRLRHVLLPHDYINYYLTGDYFMEYGDASGTALMDIRKRVWSKAAVAAVDRNLGKFLPALSPSDQPAGRLRPTLAERYGFPADTIVSAGGGDNMMGAIGTGNVEPGAVSASFGTSGTIYAHAKKPVVDPSGEIAAFCSSTGGWLPLLCTMNVTTVTEHMRALLGYDHATMDAAASMEKPGAAGLLLLPYFVGERTPNVPDGTGVLLGVNGNTLRAAPLARAAMEGVTLGMNFGLRRLRELGVRPREIRVTGGGARSPLWRQIMADIFGVPIVAMANDEGAALGAALQAAWCAAKAGGRPVRLTELTSRVVAVDEQTRCVPEPANVRRYRELQDLQDELGLAVRKVFTRHRRLLAK